jgi:hypothetical protein
MEFVTAILLPIGAIYGLIASFRVARWAGERRDQLHATEPEPIERLAADLRRLRAQLETMETRTDVPAKNLRLRALRGAYLDALTTACRRLEVSPPRVTGPPGSPQATQAEIYRVESDLRRRGLDVRQLADH